MKAPGMMVVQAMNKIWKILQYPLAVLLIGAIFLGVRIGQKSMTPFENMQSAVESTADLSLMQKADNQMFKRLYGLDANSFEGVLLYYPLTNMGVEEVLLVKVDSQEDRDAVKQAVESRLAAQMKSFDGYGVGQSEMLEKAVIRYDESYVLFCVGDQTANVEAAYLAAYNGEWNGEVTP